MTQKQIIALGFFDGVHLGHQALLRECRRLAEELNMEAAAITFDRHPQSLFTPTPPLLLNTAEDRKRLLRRCGIGPIYQFPVTEEVMSTPWQSFLAELLEFGAAGFVCGQDFRFGHKGEGDAEKLRQFCKEKGMPCVIVPDQTLDGIRISSTHIRSLVEAGDMENAARFLGHPHIFSETVVPGQHLGRTIGVPTANLTIPTGVVAPKFGVYACRAMVDGMEYTAVTNVGCRPTVSGEDMTVEPWILGFAGDLYGKTITLEFHKYLRPEKKFDSLEALREEIRKNAAQTKEFFEK